jgi:putative transposase
MTKPYTRRSSAEWQHIIDDQAESGLSAVSVG